MRRIRYLVAISLDGYIARQNGDVDWIIMDPEMDFEALYEQFDIVLFGRHTFEPMHAAGRAEMPGMKTFLFSTKLRQADYPNITIVNQGAYETLDRLRNQNGKDIWLFGGGEFFRSLSDAGLVDTVEIAVIPKLIGGGIPMYPPPAKQLNLVLTNQKTYSATGILALEYTIT